jgi:hypothetical protein
LDLPGDEGFGTPANVLRVLRENRDIQWDDLRRIIGAYPSTRVMRLQRTLEGLKRAKIIDFETDPRSEGGWEEFIKGPIKLTSSWYDIQAALNISLVDLAKQSRPGSMIVEPFFGRPSSQGSQIDLFVLMPFIPKLKPVYDDHIIGVANSLSLRAVRGDDIFSTDAIIKDVWEAINLAKVIIADCTGKNANVFYELGIAHTIGKEVIMITQDIEDIPFDVRHIRSLVYEYTPRGMKEFEIQLKKALRYILGIWTYTRDHG